jgi:hypothetical protein
MMLYPNPGQTVVGFSVSLFMLLLTLLLVISASALGNTECEMDNKNIDADLCCFDKDGER